MKVSAVERTVVSRGVDGDGYHLSPRTSCCAARVLYEHPTTKRFEAVLSDAHLVEVVRGRRALRCGRCNQPVSLSGDRNGR